MPLVIESSEEESDDYVVPTTVEELIAFVRDGDTLPDDRTWDELLRGFMRRWTFDDVVTAINLVGLGIFDLTCAILDVDMDWPRQRALWTCLFVRLVHPDFSWRDSDTDDIAKGIRRIIGQDRADVIQILYPFLQAQLIVEFAEDMIDQDAHNCLTVFLDLERFAVHRVNAHLGVESRRGRTTLWDVALDREYVWLLDRLKAAPYSGLTKAQLAAYDRLPCSSKRRQ